MCLKCVCLDGVGCVWYICSVCLVWFVVGYDCVVRMVWGVWGMSGVVCVVCGVVCGLWCVWCMEGLLWCVVCL